jgi:hypothetical protein
VAVVAVVLVPAGAARAAGAELSAVAGAYAAGGGTIPACEFTSAELNAALAEAGGDIQQYGSDLLGAIQRALSARASGACDQRSQSPAASTTTSTTVTPGAPPSAPRAAVIAPPPAPPVSAGTAIPATAIALGPLSAPTGAGIPAPIWTLAIAGLVLALGAGLAVVWRLRGWDPVWAAGARHSFGEAGYRVSGAWADFTDWVRLQR